MEATKREYESMLERNPVAYTTAEELAMLPISTLADMMAIPHVRHMIALKRWHIFNQMGGQLSFAPHLDPGIYRDTIPHNIEGITNSLTSLPSLERSELVLRPVMCIDRIYSYRERRVFPDVSVLLIGSRTEYEVFETLGYGVSPEKLHAVDLISYSPWITPGDMHALPYPDSSFDVIVMGWVLAYSATPAVVAREIVRVAKKGCIVSIGNDCFPRDRAPYLQKFANAERPLTTEELLSLFGTSSGRVFFNHEPNYPKNDIPDFTGHLIVTFEINK